MLKNRKLLIPFGTLIICNFLVAFGAVYLAAAVRFGGDAVAIAEDVGTLWYRALIFALITTIVLFCFGMLRMKHRDRFLRTGINTIAAVVISAGFFAIVSYAIPQAYLGRGILGIALLLAVAGILAVRFLFNRVVDDGYFQRRILVLGAGMAAATIEQRMRRKTDRLSFQIVGYVPVEGSNTLVDSKLVLNIQDTKLRTFVEKTGIDEIVIAVDERREKLPVADLIAMRLNGIRVTDIQSFWEHESGRLKLDVLRPSSLIFADGFSCTTWSMTQKRVVDLVMACILIVALMPLMLLVALAVWIESGFKHSVFYYQTRTGYRNKPFRMVKFRSMALDAESDGKPRWAEVNDPRVTSVGRIIRAARLDELPQLFNIAAGDMSFVGPRPERPEFVEELSRQIPYYGERHLAKPGITGWAQLSYPYGASVEDSKEKLQLDLYYLKHHSFMLDLQIMLRTVEVVFTGNGAR